MPFYIGCAIYIEKGETMISNSVKVSVVVPCYNVESYIEEALESILKQSFQSYEIIAIDDGSTDNTLKILNEFKKKHTDLKLRVYSDMNHGVGYQRNRGIKYAIGEYIYFMDSDDILNEKCLEILYNKAQKEKLDILYFEADSFYETPELQKKFPHYETAYHRNGKYNDIYTGRELFIKFEDEVDVMVSVCIQFINRKFLLENKVSFPEIAVLEDNLFYFRGLMCAQRTGCISDRLYYRRVRESSIMTTPRNAERFVAYWNIIEELAFNLGNTEEDELLQKAIWKRIRAMFRNVYREYKKISQKQLKEIYEKDTGKIKFLINLSEYANVNENQRKKVLDKQEIIQIDKKQLQEREKKLLNKLEEGKQQDKRNYKKIEQLEKDISESTKRIEKKKEKIKILKGQLKKEKEENEKLQIKMEKEIKMRKDIENELEAWKKRKIIRFIRKIDELRGKTNS